MGMCYNLGKLTIRPSDVTVDKEKVITFKCSTSMKTPVNWLYTKFNETAISKIIYESGFLTEEFKGKVNVSNITVNVPGNETWHGFDLTIFNPQCAEDGTYTCIDDAGRGPDTAAANLFLGMYKF